jgi:hypothetical protein
MRPKYVYSFWNYASPFSVWSTVFRIAAFISWFKFAVILRFYYRVCLRKGIKLICVFAKYCIFVSFLVIGWTTGIFTVLCNAVLVLWSVFLGRLSEHELQRRVLLTVFTEQSSYKLSVSNLFRKFPHHFRNRIMHSLIHGTAHFHFNVSYMIPYK